MQQHPVFKKYTRDWLHDVTGYSKVYLCRVASGKVPLSRSFIDRFCFKLGESEASLFLPDAGEAHPTPEPAHQQQAQRHQKHSLLRS